MRLEANSKRIWTGLDRVDDGVGKTVSEIVKKKRHHVFDSVQGLILALSIGVTPGGCEGSYVVMGTKPGSAVCKASTLPSLLSFWPPRDTAL